VVYSSLDETLGPRILAIPDVANVDPGVFSWIVVGDTPFFLIYGYPAGSVAMNHYRIVEGKPVTAAKQIAIGRRGCASPANRRSFARQRCAEDVAIVFGNALRHRSE
jgi:hypothetical protein